MKKIYSLLLMALIAIGAQAQTANKNISLRLSGERTLLPNQNAVRFHNTAEQPANMLRKFMKNAPRKATAQDLEGEAIIWGQNALYGPTYAGTSLTITAVNSNTISLSNITPDATNAITATVDLTNMTVSVPAGQVILNSQTYGDIVFAKYDETTKAIDLTSPITGTIDEYGQITFTGFVGEAIKSGEDAGAIYRTFYSKPRILYTNGKMDVIDLDNGNLSYNVAIFQTDDNVTNNEYTVVNFGNYGQPVVIEMVEDNKIQIQSQVMLGYGDSSSETLYETLAADWTANRLVSYVIEGTRTATQFAWTDWTAGYYNGTNYSIEGKYSDTKLYFTTDEQFVYNEIPDVEAVPANPEILEAERFADGVNSDGDYGYFAFVIPKVDIDGNLIKTSKLSYSLYSKVGTTESIITFQKTLYPELEKMKMTVIPYSFTGENFVDGGSYKVVYIRFNIDDYDAIGVKSIYEGGGGKNESDIVWYDFASAGIAPVIQNGEVGNGAIYSIDGRRLNEVPAKGLYIQNGKKYIAK